MFVRAHVERERSKTRQNDKIDEGSIVKLQASRLKVPRPERLAAIQGLEEKDKSEIIYEGWGGLPFD